MKQKHMKATIEPTEALRTSHRIETPCYFESYAIIDPRQIDPAYPTLDADKAVDLRIYTSKTGGSVSACVWISHRPARTYASGSARATGHGYHRPSEAAGEALRAAGVTLSADIGGRGDHAICEALIAIARALKIRRPILTHSAQ